MKVTEVRCMVGFHNWLYNVVATLRVCQACKRSEVLHVKFITINGVTVRKDVWSCHGSGDTSS